MELYKLNKHCLFVLLLLAFCLGGAAQNVLKDVALKKITPTSYNVIYKLEPETSVNINLIELKIFRRRDGIVSEIFSEYILPRQINATNQYTYNWRTNARTIKTGDELQAKITLFYNKAKPQAVQNANKLPIAHGGGDLTLKLPVRLVVILDASKSYDPDGSIATVNWRQLSGPNILNITTPTAYKTYVTGEFKAGIYKFELTVTDNNGGIATDEVSLTVQAPAIAATSTDSVVKKSPAQPLIAKTPTPPPRLRGGPSNALLNLVVPGIGHYFVSGDYNGKNRKPQVLLITALYAGSVGGAVYYKIRSDKTYDKYLHLSEFREYQYDANGNVIGVRGASQAQAGEYLASAKTYQKYFVILAGISAGILTADLIYTLVKGSINKKGWKAEYLANSRLIFSSDGKNFTAGLRVNF